MTTQKEVKHLLAQEVPANFDVGCSCLDSAYERRAIIAGMTTTPVFPENIEFMRKFKYGN